MQRQACLWQRLISLGASFLSSFLPSSPDPLPLPPSFLLSHCHHKRAFARLPSLPHQPLRIPRRSLSPVLSAPLFLTFSLSLPPAHLLPPSPPLRRRTWKSSSRRCAACATPPRSASSSPPCSPSSHVSHTNNAHVHRPPSGRSAAGAGPCASCRRCCVHTASRGRPPPGRSGGRGDRGVQRAAAWAVGRQWGERRPLLAPGFIATLCDRRPFPHPMLAHGRRPRFSLPAACAFCVGAAQKGGFLAAGPALPTPPTYAPPLKASL